MKGGGIGDETILKIQGIVLRTKEGNGRGRDTIQPNQRETEEETDQLTRTAPTPLIFPRKGWSSLPPPVGSPICD